MNKQLTCKGFTIIDVLITMSVVAMVASFAVPSMQAITSKNRVAAVTNEFVGALQLARSEAIKRGAGRVILRKTGGQWESGWQVFVDYNDNSIMDDSGDCGVGNDCLIREYSGLQAGYTLRTGSTRFQDWVGYLPSGQSKGSGGSNGSFYLCPRDGKIKRARKVVINMVGRVRTGHFESGDTCPS